MNFEQKIVLIQRNLEIKGYTIVAKECVGLIEQALRQLFREHLTELDERDRLKVQEAEQKIGKGEKGIDSFTMGQLVGVFRTSHFLDAWERASGKDLGSIRAINFDELTNLRNKFIHDSREAARSDAEFLFQCLQVIFEAFGVTSEESFDLFSKSFKPSVAAMILKKDNTSDNQEESLIFVSYVHTDNQSSYGTDKGWATTLIEKLKDQLNPKLGHEGKYSLWIDYSLSENLQVTSEMLDTIPNTAILLVILSRNYIISDWCQRKKNNFLRMVKERTHNDSRVFIIEYDRLKAGTLPLEFDEVTSYRYNFCVEDREPPVLMPNLQQDALRYNKLVTELSCDLAEELQKLQRQQKHAEILNKAISPTSDDRPTVLLADVTDDLHPVREEVEHYLSQANMRVLPEEPYYSYEPRAFQQAVRADLAKSSLFVQLLSALPGRRPKTLPQGYARCQYELAKEAKKPVLQWCSQDLELDAVQDADQRDFLQLDTVLAIEIDEFESKIREKAFQNSIPPSSDMVGSVVFLDAESDDNALVEHISDVFYKHGVGSVFPPQSKKPAEYREAFKQRVLHCDGLMIIYGDATSEWVTRQVMNITGIRWQRKRPFAACAIYDGPPPQKESLPFKMPGILILDCRDCPDEQKLKSFLEYLKKEETS